MQDNYTFLISKRRRTHESKGAIVFKTSSSRKGNTFTIPTPNGISTPTISIEEVDVPINERATKEYYKIVIPHWFAEMVNIEKRGAEISKGDFIQVIESGDSLQFGNVVRTFSPTKGVRNNTVIKVESEAFLLNNGPESFWWYKSRLEPYNGDYVVLGAVPC